MRYLYLTLSLSATLALAACASFPNETAEQGAASAALYFPNATFGARVSVDGSDAGEASLFDGKWRVLTVTPGNHHVVIKLDSAVLQDQIVFVGMGSRVAVKGH